MRSVMRSMDASEREEAVDISCQLHVLPSKLFNRNLQKKKEKKKKQTAFIIMFSHLLKDSYRVMFKPINTQTSCKNRQKNTSKQHS